MAENQGCVVCEYFSFDEETQKIKCLKECKDFSEQFIGGDAWDCDYCNRFHFGGEYPDIPK